jgi:formylglycine-generating enzyme required for sulfatase activity
MMSVLLSLGQGDIASAQATTPADMVTIASGSYTPLLQSSKGEPIHVAAFYLDVYAVTNAQYLAFVTANPQWQRGHVPPLFADSLYLQHWQVDGEDSKLSEALWQRPVTNVPWFAAKAYCQWQHKRLPRMAEWEYVALASADVPDASTDPAYLRQVLAWYSVPNPAVPPLRGSGGKNFWGVYDMHGVVWEWVADFNTALVTGESRGDSALERNLYCGAGFAGVAEAQKVNYAAFMRYAYRSSLQGHYTVNNLGFRCAKDVQ